MRAVSILAALMIGTSIWADPAKEKYQVGDIVKIVGRVSHPDDSFCNVEWRGKGGAVNKQETVGWICEVAGEVVRSGCSYNSYYLREINSGEVIGAKSRFPKEWQYVPHWLRRHSGPVTKPEPIADDSISDLFERLIQEVDNAIQKASSRLATIEKEIARLEGIKRGLEGLR